MKDYSRADAHRMPIPMNGHPEVMLYIASGTHFEDGLHPTDLQAVQINLIGPPEIIDLIMQRWGLDQ